MYGIKRLVIYFCLRLGLVKKGNDRLLRFLAKHTRVDDLALSEWLMTLYYD